MWSEWETFSCDKSCGGGERNKMRTKIPTESYDGECEGKEYVTEKCNTEECAQDFSEV